MNKYALLVVFVFLIILSYYFGRKLYINTHDGFMRDNCTAIIFNMRNELMAIDYVLGDGAEPKEANLKNLRQTLLQRRKTLVNNLNMFYGQNYFS